MNINVAPQASRELILYRRMTALGALIYLLWWAAVEFFLPGAFNPLASRLAVVLFFALIAAASFVSEWVRSHLRLLFVSGIWLLTAHYFYLFHGNVGDANWVTGTYITIVATTLTLFTNAILLSYSVFVVALALLLMYLKPELGSGVFFPGLITILLQANIGLRTRLGLLRTLENSNSRFQLLFNSTFEGLFVHTKGKVIDVNDALIKMIGFDRTELLGRDALEIVDPQYRADALAKMTKGEGNAYETRGIRKDGKALDIEVRAKSFDHGKETYRLVTVQDITDRKTAERERVASLTMMENVRVRDEFISIASHELKTPISSLRLQTQMIQRFLQKNPTDPYPPERMKDIVNLYDRQVHRLTELVESMLDVSRLSTGRLTLKKENISFTDIILETVESMQFHGVEIGIDLPVIVSIYADRTRMKQVIENLLSNAIKYGAGKPIQLTLETDDVSVILKVIDQGIGIADHAITKIFERYERAISSRNISGLGLGLYISKEIIEAHGGNIRVVSQLGQGSCFVMTLPLPNTITSSR